MIEYLSVTAVLVFWVTGKILDSFHRGLGTLLPVMREINLNLQLELEILELELNVL